MPLSHTFMLRIRSPSDVVLDRYNLERWVGRWGALRCGVVMRSGGKWRVINRMALTVQTTATN